MVNNANSAEIGKVVPRSVGLPGSYWEAADGYCREHGMSRSELFRRLFERAGIVPDPNPTRPAPQRISPRPAVKRPTPRPLTTPPATTGDAKHVRRVVAASEDTPGSPAWRKKKAASGAGRVEIAEFDATRVADDY
jgi:hypothetical protein